MKQYKLLTGPDASKPATKLQAAQLAREAVTFDQKWAKYLHYVPAL